ncbi:sodium-dependent nutrient amino acid transporter 1-like isoform X2 [Trichoplusia ni]|uniref:Transporter n=1 Tax=Trichoplusia ni TaxID=7111 RepID=A0A7E5V9Q2_TRINI|nr:sodium-dependent nutrient amino acid transporter 1-like isoform X1 [Trichoplusia ni]XP_026725015.1 sodium-dependent nutrient amino acid transporter 1-like isoform X2 [Trichoplusia ni]
MDSDNVKVENGTNENKAFDPTPENLDNSPSKKSLSKLPEYTGSSDEIEKDEGKPERPQWDNQYQFLMSCIATSVGLGNVWRFPFVAYQNGGGAFLIPYIVVLILIGKPMYYLETTLGQFSSSNCVKIWALSPAMKGTGYAQGLSAIYVVSYYMSIVGLCLYYLVMSFQSVLPWAVCRPEWENCVPSGQVANLTEMTGEPKSSAELYFTQTILRQSDGIHDGLGAPLWDLTLSLFISWVIVFLIVSRGVKSSGKAAYFLALFPYVVMIILLIRAVTLEGAGNGILFFITPQWEKILEIRVWYAAVTQAFFSLSVCSGALIMFSSYNNFTQNVYRDSLIVTTLDTFTSLISGITIFGILGNLAFQLGYDNVSDVIGSGGSSLAFISYPDAIAQSPFVPQLFAALFFMMMAVLGIGSGVALFSTVNTILMDTFPRVPVIYMSAMGCSAGFLIGLVYVTPGGQYILELVDYYGGTFMRLFAAIVEVIGVFWIYGLENMCLDIEFMLKIKNSFYWRICWSIITPVMMLTVFFYALITTEELLFGGTYEYPAAAYVAATILQYAGIILIPICIILSLWKYRTSSVVETVRRAFGPKKTYGPKIPEIFDEWKEFRRNAKYDRELKRKNWFHHIGLSLIGGYRWGK